MKKPIFLGLLSVFLLLSPRLASADVLTFVTHGSAANTPSSSWTSTAGPVKVISPNLAWYTPPGTNWISSWDSGAQNVPGYYSPANGTVVTFTLDFLIPTNFIVSSVTLNVLADDTTNGFINGHQIFDYGSGQAPYCVVTSPGCVESTLWSGSVNPTWFQSGMNQMTFSPKQLFGYSYGLNSELKLTGEYRDQVPEPATITLLLVGVSLVLIGRVAAKN